MKIYSATAKMFIYIIYTIYIFIICTLQIHLLLLSPVLDVVLTGLYLVYINMGEQKLITNWNHYLIYDRRLFSFTYHVFKII